MKKFMTDSRLYMASAHCKNQLILIYESSTSRTIGIPELRILCLFRCPMAQLCWCNSTSQIVHWKKLQAAQISLSAWWAQSLHPCLKEIMNQANHCHSQCCHGCSHPFCDKISVQWYCNCLQSAGLEIRMKRLNSGPSRDKSVQADNCWFSTCHHLE